MTAPAPARNLLDLHMPIDPDGSASAVAPLAWCVTDELMLEVNAAKYYNPHLLVIDRVKETSNDFGHENVSWREVAAHIVPLKQAFYYFTFTRPGEHELVAFVIDIPDKKTAKRAKSLRDNFRSRAISGNDGYLNANGSLFSHFNPTGEEDPDEFGYYYGRESLEPRFSVLRRRGESVAVHVPAEMFAPEPAAWRKSLVRTFFRMREQDQCHFRKRFIASLVFAAVVAPVKTFVRLLLIVFGTLSGFRGIGYKGLFHPLAPIDNVTDGMWWNAFFSDATSPPRFTVWSVLNLPVLVVLGALSFLLYKIGGHNVVAALIVFAIVTIVSTGLVMLGDKMSNIAAWLSAREQREIQAYRTKVLADLEKMRCETNLPANSFSELPSDKKTVSLRYYDFKTKVCKPFAR